ncbi:hypothetical protein KI659_16610 [Litoribacter alkaliphilus]|uniref:Uncharacterized protein n=1 Tax=Litoribacter ruber TaxID=702568 RepID=A0AAP2CPQ1_9BACT|nr:hypothetical protein [Litoribacter alkaliphilus]MBS9525642.1 hypothetical protein [Litoribacter alkaliphilus]
MDGGIYLVGVGGLVTVLLSLSGFLLRYLVQDLRELKSELAELKTGVHSLQGEQLVMKSMLVTQLGMLRKRVQVLEKVS